MSLILDKIVQSKWRSPQSTRVRCNCFLTCSSQWQMTGNIRYMNFHILHGFLNHMENLSPIILFRDSSHVDNAVLSAVQLKKVYLFIAWHFPNLPTLRAENLLLKLESVLIFNHFLTDSRRFWIVKKVSENLLQTGAISSKKDCQKLSLFQVRLKNDWFDQLVKA